jgi:hypothetical protein
MEQIGYSLVDASGNEVQFFGDTKGRLHAIPQPIVLPNGDQVHGAEVGDQLGEIKVVGRWLVDEQPSEWFEPSGRAVAFDGEKIVVTVQYTERALNKTLLLEYAKSVRYNKEVGGIAVGGVPVLTDDRSKQMIMGARIAADSDPNFTTTWVGADGNLYPITAAQIIGISNAVLANTNNCFLLFANVQAGIAGGTITTPAEIDAVFA